MASDPSWRPNESASQIWIEQGTLDGVVIEAVGYGAHLTLFFQCFNLLWEVRRRQPRFAYTYLAYISLLSVACSIGAGCSFRVNQEAYVDFRNFPGGPAQYTLLGFNKLNVIGPAAYMVCAWLQDGLLLYRFYVIYGEAIRPLIIPGLIFLSTIVFSGLVINEINKPGNTLSSSGNLGVVLGLGLTTCLTTLLLSTLIVARLLYTRYKLRKVMGSGDLAPYLTVSAMIVESAMLYMVTALTFIIMYAANSTGSYLIYSFLGQAPSIAPLLIIRRVAEGRAASKEAMLVSTEVHTRIQFAPAEVSTATTGTVDLGPRNESTLTKKETIINLSSMAESGSLNIVKVQKGGLGEVLTSHSGSS